MHLHRTKIAQTTTLQPLSVREEVPRQTAGLYLVYTCKLLGETKLTCLTYLYLYLNPELVCKDQFCCTTSLRCVASLAARAFVNICRFMRWRTCRITICITPVLYNSLNYWNQDVGSLGSDPKYNQANTLLFVCIMGV